jgi:hypothetical protein
MYGYDKNFDVEKFLIDIKSPLVPVRFREKRVWDIINDSCDIDKKVNLVGKTFKGINQKWLITTIQKESSGITQPLSPRLISRVLGYGIPDRSPIHVSTLGFENQLKYGARRLFDYTDSKFQKEHNGFINKPFKTDFGKREVIPVNQATLSNYFYTPFDGRFDYPKYSLKAPYGNYLFYKVWLKFFREEPNS